METAAQCYMLPVIHWLRGEDVPRLVVLGDSLYQHKDPWGT